MPRDYKREYASYHGTEEQKKKRALRNKARRQAIREGKAAKGDGKMFTMSLPSQKVEQTEERK